MPINRRIKNRRLIQNLTQEYLAIKLGISVKTYRKIERGELELSVSQFHQVCYIFEIDPRKEMQRETEKFELNNCIKFINTQNYQYRSNASGLPELKEIYIDLIRLNYKMEKTEKILKSFELSL